MIQEAIESIVELAKKGETGQVVRDVLTPGALMMVRGEDSALKIEMAPAGPRRHKLASMDGVLSALDALTGDRAGAVVVYVGPSSVTVSLTEESANAMLDGADSEFDYRQHLATWSIPWSQRLLLLEAQERQEKGRWNAARKGADDQNGPLEALKQQGMVDLLSTVFCGDRVSIEPADLLPTLRSIRFKSATDGQSTVNPGRSSIAAEVVEQTIGTDREIPERCTLHFAPIDGSPLALPGQDEVLASIGCAVIVRPETKQMGLIPDPGACAAARRLAIDFIGGAIEAHIEKNAALKGVRVIVGADFT